jgi:hypothetical protein
MLSEQKPSQTSFTCQPELVEGFYELPNRFRQAQPDIGCIFEMIAEQTIMSDYSLPTIFILWNTDVSENQDYK